MRARLERRVLRVRSKVKRAKFPRLVVFRSNRNIWASIINGSGRVLVSSSTKNLKDFKGTKTQAAREVGILLSRLAMRKKLKNVVFDRGPYHYHGRVKAVALGAREGGLIF